jgi:hypothetical protein
MVRQQTQLKISRSLYAFCTALCFRRSHLYRQMALRPQTTRETSSSERRVLWETDDRQFCRKLRIKCHCWDLLYAANLRHWTDSFTFPPKEGALTVFAALKYQTPSAGLKTANSGTKSWCGNL